jgi:hypothetical protein
MRSSRYRRQTAGVDGSVFVKLMDSGQVFEKHLAGLLNRGTGRSLAQPCMTRHGLPSQCDIPNSKPGKSAKATEAYINFYVVATSKDRIQFRK